MKFRSLNLALALAAGMLLGCKSTDPDNFGPMVQQWVPLGTSTADAKRIMKDQGFDCAVVAKDNIFNHSGMEILDCDKAKWLHVWHTEFMLKDGKVFSYGPTSVESQR